MMTGRRLGDGSDNSNCRTRPCPFCAIGKHHELTIEEAVEWWRARCDDFVHKPDLQNEGPCPFFIQAMAVKLIMRNNHRDRPDNAPGVFVTLAEQCGNVASVTR